MEKFTNEPLADWERELLYGNPWDCRPIGEGDVTFTRTDGGTVTINNVRVDSIGPSAENKGVIGVEFYSDSMQIVHIPFVESWEITY